MKKFLLPLSLFLLFNVTGKAQQVTLGTGSAISAFSPFTLAYGYNVYEIIYLQSQIMLSGPITRLAFERYDGSHDDSLQNVSIYMRQTTSTTMSNGNYSDGGYTLVYSGLFPNEAGAGWREVILDTPFQYTNNSHLQVLAVKGYEPVVGSTPISPRWIYTNTSPNRARRYYGNNAISSSTPLTSTPYSANARLTIGTTGSVEIYPGLMSVYPNPAQGSINFQLDQLTAEGTLLIYTQNGQLLLEEKVSAKRLFTTPVLKQGMYLYRFQSDNSSSVINGKFVME